MKPRKTIYHHVREKSQSRTPNIDNCKYIIRTPTGQTIYTSSNRKAAFHDALGATIYKRIEWFDDELI